MLIARRQEVKSRLDSIKAADDNTFNPTANAAAAVRILELALDILQDDAENWFDPAQAAKVNVHATRVRVAVAGIKSTLGN
jgi:hypothetical protein